MKIEFMNIAIAFALILCLGCVSNDVGAVQKEEMNLSVIDNLEDNTTEDTGIMNSTKEEIPKEETVIVQPADEKEDSGMAEEKTLAGIEYWAYQIQDQEWYGNIGKLEASHYDMLVIDDTRTIKDDEDDMTSYEMAADVSKLKKSKNSTGGEKIVIAYIDIGEAEDYRWYWKKDWMVGNPDFIEIEDPDGWSGNYPVKYWDSEWKGLTNDYLDIIIDDGFDGIYMDWIEGYENEDIQRAAVNDGKNARDEMINFICEISNYTKTKKAGFYVIAQNGVELGTSKRYLDCIDAVAQEQIWFDGVADAEKGGSEEGDYPMDATGEYSTSYYISHLENFKNAGKPVFSVDYAQKQTNVDKAYSEAQKNGYIPYVSIRSLSRLTNTPPPGY